MTLVNSLRITLLDHQAHEHEFPSVRFAVVRSGQFWFLHQTTGGMLRTFEDGASDSISASAHVVTEPANLGSFLRLFVRWPQCFVTRTSRSGSSSSAIR